MWQMHCEYGQCFGLTWQLLCRPCWYPMKVIAHYRMNAPCFSQLFSSRSESDVSLNLNLFEFEFIAKSGPDRGR